MVGTVLERGREWGCVGKWVPLLVARGKGVLVDGGLVVVMREVGLFVLLEGGEGIVVLGLVVVAGGGEGLAVVVGRGGEWWEGVLGCGREIEDILVGVG